MFLFAKDKMSLLEEEKMETLLMSIKELSRPEVSRKTKEAVILRQPPLLFFLALCEGVNQQFEIPTYWVQNGTGTSTFSVFHDFGACFRRCA